MLPNSLNVTWLNFKNVGGPSSARVLTVMQ
nr:MAG TPA: hypothetical protein [Caudoviricetes sp.]